MKRRWAGRACLVGPEEIIRDGCRAAAGVARFGRTGRARGPDVAVAVDDEIDPHARHDVDGPWPPGRCGHRRQAVAPGGIQPAVQRKDPGGQTESGPRRAVPIHQRRGQGPPPDGDPVLSVDAKKKELAGDYRNAGKEWRRAGDPSR